MRVGAHDGMDADREVARTRAVGEVGRRHVARGEAEQELLDRRRERLVGLVHVGEERVAAALGHDLHAQHRDRRRLRFARDVRVPGLAGGVLGAGVGVDDEDLGPFGVGVGRMDVQRAEPATEGDLLVDVHRLPAGDDDAALGDQPGQLIDAGVVERVELLGADLGAEPGRDRRARRWWRVRRWWSW